MRRSFLFAACAMIAGTSTLYAPTSQAAERLRAEGHIFRWSAADGAPAVVTYAITQTPLTLPAGLHTLSHDNCGSMEPFSEIVARSPGLNADDASRELDAAFSAWSSVAAIDFHRVSDPNTADIVIAAGPGNSGRALTNLAYKDGSPPAIKALGAGSAALPVQPATPPREPQLAAIGKAYICLDPNLPWKTGFDGNLSVYDLRYTFMHEIGHAIGLDHPGRSGGVMGFRYDETNRVLSPSDISAVTAIYGLREPSLKPDK